MASARHRRILVLGLSRPHRLQSQLPHSGDTRERGGCGSPGAASRAEYVGHRLQVVQSPPLDRQLDGTGTGTRRSARGRLQDPARIPPYELCFHPPDASGGPTDRTWPRSFVDGHVLWPFGHRSDRHSDCAARSERHPPHLHGPVRSHSLRQTRPMGRGCHGKDANERTKVERKMFLMASLQQDLQLRRFKMVN